MSLLMKQVTQAVRLSYATVKQSVSRRKGVLFSKYLLATNTVISVSSSGLGDLLQQKYEVVCKRQNSLNLLRTCKIAVTGAPSGAACHFWYIWLDKFLVKRTFKNVCKKIILDQVLFSPVLIILFLVTFGVLEKTSLRSVASEFWGKGASLYKAELFIWPPAQFVNFFFLPTKYRVLYDSVICVGFDCYYPYIAYKKKHCEEAVNTIQKEMTSHSNETDLNSSENLYCDESVTNKVPFSHEVVHDIAILGSFV